MNIADIILTKQYFSGPHCQEGCGFDLLFVGTFYLYSTVYEGPREYSSS